MDYKEIEKKWQKKWSEDNLYKFDEDNTKDKFYLLEMFSYPSGAKLHLGHWWNYGLSDSFGRFKRLQGYNVFQPMGFDAFGLPAENYAIKTGVHPEESTKANIARMEEQLKTMGATFNWEYEIKTCFPDYYKWSQWFFLKLYENGLAYQKHAPVNWCTGCKTVLANEQVVNGQCERCHGTIIKKDMTQWFFKITDYCEELLEGLDRIDWPEKTKIAQRNWIGKSVGGEIVFKTEKPGYEIRVFTSRADTVFGVSFLVLAPENKLVDKLVTEDYKNQVEAYRYETSKKDEISRTSTADEKTGVFTGAYCINPLTGARVPILVADYVLNSYGTGAVMGVGAHDERDFDFAKKYNLAIPQVIEPIDGSKCELPYCDHGKLINSGEFNGLTTEEAIPAIISKLEIMGAGNAKTNYKIRDWSISRQRYWGCPIPMIHCEHCGIVPVPEKDLPVLLPKNVDWTPGDGSSPLSRNEEFMNCTCPKCGGKARRDGDTCDGYLCSSWYFLRYPNAHNDKEPFDSEKTNAICPVDTYVGGIEHATGHLLYSRFFTKFMHKLGLLNFDEPFKRLVHQGMILGEDGQKMSKSLGNTVSADEYIAQYGSDSLRLYLMFGFNYIDGGPWNSEGIKSIIKFMERVERITLNAFDNDSKTNNEFGNDEKELSYALNYCIKNVTTDFNNFSFNTSIARIMELVNALYKYDNKESKNMKFMKEVVKATLIMLSPAAPHFTEELWQQIGESYSIFNQKYPICDETKLVKDEIEIAVQINSKIVARIMIPTNASNDEITSISLSCEKVKSAKGDEKPKKVIVIANRLINLIY